MRRVVGALAIAVFASCAREASAQPELAPGSKLMPLSEVASALRGRVRPGVPNAGGKGHLDLEDAKRTARVASIVAEGTVEGFLLPSPRARFAVTSVLKGSTDSEQFIVDLSKAPFGLWPHEKQEAILCLAKPTSGSYELASFHTSILPATGSVRKAVKDWLAGCVSVPPKPELNPYARQAAASETILIGTLGNVRPATNGKLVAIGTFDVADSLLGYGAYRTPITVCFPASNGRPEAPEAGKHLLFLAGSQEGDGFVAIDGVRLTDAAVEAKVRKQSLAALGSRNGTLTTIQAALSEWQDSWNTLDFDRCIRCYSRKNGLRRQYEAGGAARKGLAGQFAGFAGKIGASIEHIGKAPVSTETCDVEGNSRSSEIAHVRMALILSTHDSVDSRKAMMKFVHEDGEWLILDEGF